MSAERFGVTPPGATDLPLVQHGLEENGEAEPARPRGSVLFPRVPDRGNLFSEQVEGTIPIGGVINRARARSSTPWNSVSRPAVRTLITLAAQDPGIGLPPSMFGEGEFKKPLQLLDGRSLSGLYQHVNVHPERNGRNIVALIQDTVGIETKAVDVIAALRKKKQVTWRLVPQEAAAGVLEAFAAHLEKPPSMLTYDELQYPNQFFRGGSLAGMIGHSFNHPERGNKEAITFILHDLGFVRDAEDIIELARLYDTANVRWKTIPQVEIRKILEKAAAEVEGGIPLNLLVSDDLAKTKFTFLNGRTLRSLPRYWASHPDREDDETSMQFMRRALGLDEPSPNERAKVVFMNRVGSNFTAENIIEYIKSYPNKGVFWDYVPWSEVSQILERSADELEVPLNMLTTAELEGNKFEFLEGLTLSGFYRNLVRHPEKETNETSTQFMRKKLELSEPAQGESARFRFKQMRRYFDELPANDGEGQQSGSLNPWIQATAKLYERWYMNIEHGEIQNEIFVFLHSPEAGEFTDQTTLLSALHGHLERYVRDTSTRWYKEKSLATSLGDNFTIADVLEDREKSPSTQDIPFSAKMEASLSRLSPLQRQIVLEVTVSGRSFDDLGDELGMDLDMLTEQYNDALGLMRNDFEE